MSQATPARDVPWEPLLRGALVAGLVGGAVWAAGWGLAVFGSNPELHRKVFFAYLFAFASCLAIPLGSMAIWMLHNLTGGAWGQVIHRPLEAATRTLPYMALLFVPLVFGLPQLYLWADPGHVHGHELKRVIEHREAYMNPTFFLMRAAVYFAVWSFLSWRLTSGQTRLDRGWEPRLGERMGSFSGPALVAYGLTVTLASIDWIMSLEPEFFSTIFGVLVAMGQFVPAMAFAIAIACWLGLHRPLADEPLHPETRGDLGSMLLAVVMLWAYMSFSQLLLVWSGNLPEEAIWYVRRSQGGWQYVAVLLAVFYFAVPFALLLSRHVKRDPRKLMTIAWMLVGVSALHHFWLINPVYASITGGVEEQGMLTAGSVSVHWLDAAALLGVGGLSLALFLWQLQRRPLTPPFQPAALEEAHHA